MGGNIGYWSRHRLQTYCREKQPSRYMEQDQRQIRLDAPSSVISVHKLYIRSTQHRPVCHNEIYTMRDLQQSVLRTIISGGRRTCAKREHNNYVNPPFCLMSKVLDVIIAQHAHATIIAPKWPGQIWYPVLQKICVSPPIKIPNNPRAFRRQGYVTPEPRRNPWWQIYAWRVYGGLS